LDHHKKHAAAIDDHGKLIQAMRKLYDSSFFDRILTGLGKPYASASVGNHVHDLIKLGHPVREADAKHTVNDWRY